MKYFIVKTNLYSGGYTEEILKKDGAIEFYDKSTAECIATNKTMHDSNFHYYAQDENKLKYYRAK